MESAPPPRCPPPVSDPAAVAAHAQALLQVGSKTGGSDAATAVGAHTLLILPLVVHLAKDVHARLVHNFWGGRNQHYASTGTMEQKQVGVGDQKLLQSHSRSHTWH